MVNSFFFKGSSTDYGGGIAQMVELLIWVVEDFGFSEIGGGLALISGFWGDLEKMGSK